MIQNEVLIPASAKEDFITKGYTMLPQFYDAQRDVAPIQEGIRVILELMCQKYSVDAPTDTSWNAMTKAYPALIARNRAWGGEVYDAIKQIPAFMMLVTKAKNLTLLHAGYAHPDDREAKYARYSAHANNGHNDSHIESILAAPSLKGWNGQMPPIWRGVRGI